jgi:DNA-binding transcriptional regulator YhcF (GntR family)
MQFRIEQASGRAVYQQIIDQVKRDIALGKVRLARFLKENVCRQCANWLVS